MKKPKSPEATLQSLSREMHKAPIVESSARHAERKGSTIGNAEQKIGVFVSRIEGLPPVTRDRLVDRYTDTLIIHEGDIPESYWRQQEQIQRDNGLPQALSPSDREYITEQLQSAQRTGIDSWLHYLQYTGDQYPAWFKVYAAEGMSSLATFNKQKGVFNRRSKGTVAPYPQLDPAALAQVYDAVLGAHGDAEPSADEQVQDLASGGNFNKLYSHFLVESKAVIKTPENAEDVHGEWKHYTEEDIPEITEAAQSTPWCIAGTEMARRYTNHYGGSFYLFHLQDQDTGVVSPTAAASIRMQRGSVAEISGLKQDQSLEDALVPEVMQKVNSLPGGDRYLEAFRDKQQMIALDKKFQAGEAFTTDELKFMYEIDRAIKYLNNRGNDPRLRDFKQERETHEVQLREVYGKEAALKVLTEYEIPNKLEELLDKGVSVDMLTPYLGAEQIFKERERLAKAGAVIDIKGLYPNLMTSVVLQNLDDLRAAGVQIQPYELMNRLHQQELGYHVSSLLSAGVDVRDLMEKLDTYDISNNVNTLLEAGGDAKIIMRSLNIWGILGHLPELMAAGASVDLQQLVDHLSPWALPVYAERLIQAGFDAQQLAEKLPLEAIEEDRSAQTYGRLPRPNRVFHDEYLNDDEYGDFIEEG